MADTWTGLIYPGLFLCIGCFFQVAQTAVVQEVHVVPSQGHAPSGHQPSHPTHTGHYPPPHPAYPGGFPDSHPPYNVPGHHGPADPQYPGQAQQGAFSSNTYPPHTGEAQNMHPQDAGHGQLTPGQGTQPGGAAPYRDHFAAQSQAGYPQQGIHGYPDPSQGASAQSQPTYPGSSPAGYPQTPNQPAYPAQSNSAVYPYHQGTHQYPGSYPQQGYPAQPPAGFPNPPQGAFSDPSAQTAAGAALPPQSQGRSQSEAMSAYPDPASAGAQTAAGAAQPGGQQAIDTAQPGQLPGSPPTATNAAAGGPEPKGTVPYPGAPNGDPASQPQLPVTGQSPEYPIGNAIPSQNTGSIVPFKYQDKKMPSFPPTGAIAEAQAKVTAGSQSGFPPPQGQAPVGTGLGYPNPHAGTPQQAPPVPYPGQLQNAHPPYTPRGYPYPGPYTAHRPYPNVPTYPGALPHGHVPYPGQSPSRYRDPHGRPFPGGAPSQTTKQGPQLNQQHRFTSHNNNNNNNNPPPQPTTTTAAPETTPGATPFPPELRCFAQSECELGCCYASDGSILWDHQNNYRKEGYCYTKTATLPGEGCHPIICPCQTDQTCISVPSENATIPTLVGEAAEGVMTGNPKCYTQEQQIQIHDWLKKLETIVIACRYDHNCPLTAMHHK